MRNNKDIAKKRVFLIGNGCVENGSPLCQRETDHLVGSLAAKSLVVLRNVFEALIYVSFTFIIPMLFLPMGLKLLNTWTQTNGIMDTIMAVILCGFKLYYANHCAESSRKYHNRA